MSEPQPPLPENTNIADTNTLKIISLWEKIIGQTWFGTEDGNFSDRSGYAIGKLRITEKNLEIIVQQNANNGARTIAVAKITDGLPIVTSTIPSDGNDTPIQMNGRISDASEFYDGVLALLPDKHIGTEELSRLVKEKADRILLQFI